MMKSEGGAERATLTYYKGVVGMYTGADFLPQVFYIFKELLGMIGVIIILMGAGASVHEYYQAIVQGKEAPVFNQVRQTFACYIVLGLEFLLASDIVMTIMAPDYYTLGILGGLVIIRTVMTISLDRDIKQAA